MTKTKSTKRALLMSALSLLMCVSMLIGSTFAWFTDSVTSSGNIIKSGTLDVTMEWKDANANGAQKTYKDASAGPIFNYDLWEPGYVEAKNIKISNIGTLALKYQLNIAATGTVSKLADVIDVYYADGEVELNDRADMFGLTKLGKLADVLAKISTTASGNLLAGEDHTVTLALKMQETADNEYQGLAIGSEFAVQLLATQLTSEFDSFDNQYDAEAAWDGTIPDQKPDTLVVDPEKKLISINDVAAFAYLNTLVENESFRATYGSTWQYTIELNTDVNLMGKAWTPIVLKNFIGFEGNGHTISNLYVSTTGNSAGLFAVVSSNDSGNTYIKNFTINGATVNGNKYVGAVIGSGTNAAVENVTVNNANVTGIKYVGGIFGSGNGDANKCTVKNSTITIDQIVIDPEDNSIDSKEAAGLIGYVSNDGHASTTNKVIAGNTVENVTITAPTIASGLVAQPNSSNSGGAKIEIKNNTMKNVIITTTEDDTAELYVSNNVGGKSIVVDNTAKNCKAVKTVSAATQEELNNIVSAGDAVNLDLAEGNYTMPDGSEGSLRGKTITISGTKDTVIDVSNVDERDQFVTGATLKFEGVTLNFGTALYMGFANCEELIYKDCVINGVQHLYGDSITFDGCTLNVTGDHYMVRTWGGKNVTFNDCTFNCDGKAVLVYNQSCNLTVNNCVFNDNGDGTISGKAAIEACNGDNGDNCVTHNIVVTNTTVNGFDVNTNGINTGSTLWANKNSLDDAHLNVTIDGTVVY